MKLKRIGAEAILTTMIAPILIGLLFWFTGFVISTYNVIAEVDNQKSDIKEIKLDVKELLKRSYK